MIELQNVSFQYADSNYGVTNINLAIKVGECVVLTGKSGCGKTTITRLINGLAPKYYKGSGSPPLTRELLLQYAKKGIIENIPEK